ncbi:MAG: 2'-5' RNA ligase family protein [Spirochaetales bacterium]|nr:2'-5' RNA ligase family protein [Spirochaetales bacterium]
MESRRYVLITEVPSHIAEIITPVREEMARLFSSYAALAYPPHITLRTGLIVPAQARAGVFEHFAALTKDFGSLPVETDGIMHAEYAPRKYLVAYRIKKTKQLCDFHDVLLSYTAYRKSDRTDFEPHMTLLFDDLAKDSCEQALDHIHENEKNFPQLRWQLSEYGLYYLEGRRWKPEVIYPLGRPV